MIGGAARPFALAKGFCLSWRGLGDLVKCEGVSVKAGKVARGYAVNRAQLQTLAEKRLGDAEALLLAGRWSAAYYLAGYAAECGLKSCILHHVDQTGMIFRDRKYLKALGDCWTHQLDLLVNLAGLEVQLEIDTGANPVLLGYWGVAKDWKETSRYEDKIEPEARALYEALTHEPDGVMRWIRTHW